MRFRCSLAFSVVLTAFILGRFEALAESSDWSFRVEPDDNIFTSWVFMTASLDVPADSAPPTPDSDYIGDSRGVIEIDVVNPSDNAKVEITVQANPLWQESKMEAVLPRSGAHYILAPKINYFFDTLSKYRESQPLNVGCTVSINGGSPDYKFKTVRLHPINECLYAMIDRPSGKMIDLSFIAFGIYVNEDDPKVREILAEATQRKLVNQFTGYQFGPNEVLNQVAAIWDVLQRRGIKYCDITTTATTSMWFRSQYVRFIDGSLQDTQANCVDGSVLFASILQKIGIHSYLVLVPGHCFVGFQADSQNLSAHYLETTMIGSVNLDQYPEEVALENGLVLQYKNNISRNSFNQALQFGSKEYSMHTLAQDVKIVDIPFLRTHKIYPISTNP